MKALLCSLLILGLGASTNVYANDGVKTPQVLNIASAESANVKEISPKAQYGAINTNNVHFRSAPGTSSTIYGQLHKGYKVTLPYEDEKYADGLWWRKIIPVLVRAGKTDRYLKSYKIRSGNWRCLGQRNLCC